MLITGAALRLGAVMARRFAAEGWHVVIHYRRSAEAAHRLAAELDRIAVAEAIAADLAEPGAAWSLAGQLAPRLRDWRALINCASSFELDGHEQVDPVVFAGSMRTNAAAPAQLAQAYLAQARAGNGRHVINVLDQKLANMNPDFFSYTMSKAALAAATEMLAMAHDRGADRIYGLAPGAMLPSFDQVSEEHQISGRLNLLGRLTRPEELADAALFLASGRLATGQTIFVDSGQHLMRQRRDVLFLARDRG